MNLDQQLDTLLTFIRENEGIPFEQLEYKKELQEINFTTCFNKLKKDKYVFVEKGSTNVKTTASGKLFQERGGYCSESHYVKRTLGLSITNNRLMWVSVIIAGLALLVAIYVAYLQINSGANNSK